MSLTLSAETERLLRDQMAQGDFATEDDLLREALKALASQRDVLAAIADGLSDLDAGRTRPLREADSDLRANHGIRRAP